ncbi:MAG: DUF3500 domain-containing protein [Bryobacterales bacterium]|nr:DUF3500 domain-containing protein [Bryobacterales bacterium]
MATTRNFDRRQFLAAASLGGPALAASATTLGSQPKPETLVAQLHESLTDHQRQTVVLPFDNPLRSRVENNWHITNARVGRFFTRDQQALIEEIFMDLHAPDFHDSLKKHVADDFGSVRNLSVALFGEPGSGEFEFVITGRHCTVRCDGDSVDGAAFGGPIFYGHEGESFYESPTHPNNVYWFQAKRANEVFSALDGRQRAEALQPRAPRERSVFTVEPSAEPDGLHVSEMSRDQRELVSRTLADLLSPFRKRDQEEALSLIEGAGGVDNLTMAFYQNEDLGNDGVWDVWKLESPTMVWYFRGSPHVHVWVNVQENPGWKAPGSTSGRRSSGGARRRGRANA